MEADILRLFSEGIYTILAFQKLQWNASFYYPDRREAKRTLTNLRSCYLAYTFFSCHFCISTIFNVFVCVSVKRPLRKD